MSTQVPIVIDNGSHRIKAGFADTFEPQHVFRGDIAKTDTQMFAVTNPNHLPRGSVVSNVLDPDHSSKIDWNGIERLYQYLICDKMQIDLADRKSRRKFLITTKSNTDTASKAKYAEMMFESFRSDALYFGISTSLSLFAQGRTTGVVVESGHRTTHIDAVFEGAHLPLFSDEIPIGGATVDSFLQTLLTKSNASSAAMITLKDAEKLKIHAGYACIDFADESALKNTENAITYTLPDNKELKTVRMNAERFQCVEVMFRPSMFEAVKEERSLPDVIQKAISKSEQVLQSMLYKSIVLSGGNTLFKGIVDRICNDVRRISPARCQVAVHAASHRHYACWTGGALLAMNSGMDDVWITQEIYEEEGGLRCLMMRCF